MGAVGINEIVDDRRMEQEQLLRDLTGAKPARFDAALPAVLPKAHGLYAISMIGAPDGEYLHVGPASLRFSWEDIPVLFELPEKGTRKFHVGEPTK